MLLGTLGTRSLGNMLVGKGIDRAGLSASSLGNMPVGEGINRAGHGTKGDGIIRSDYGSSKDKKF